MSSQYSPPVRLRRDFRAVSLHNFGVSFMLGVPAVALLVVLLNTGDVGPFEVALVLLGFSLLLSALLSRTELAETELRSGLWPKRQILDRSEIISARPYTIKGSLYGSLHVIYVQRGAEEQIVRLSQQLGAKRQGEWLDAINAWCGAQ